MLHSSLDQLINAIENQLVEKEHVVVSICGGSCTRKSSLISAHLIDYFNEKCILISQDQFQLQLSYIKNVHPHYKWDHPDNFGISECYNTLTKLKQNQSVEVPDYNFKKGEPITYKIITPAPLIIFEGLYANYNELQDLNDISVYVKSEWYARMIRRIFRNTLDRYKGREAWTIVDSFCGSVTKAHFDLVKIQEQSSDFIIETPLQFDEIIQYYNLKSIDYSVNSTDEFFSIHCKEDISFKINTVDSELFEFLYFYHGKLYAAFNITAELAKKLNRIDWLAY